MGGFSGELIRRLIGRRRTVGGGLPLACHARFNYCAIIDLVDIGERQILRGLIHESARGGPDGTDRQTIAADSLPSGALQYHP